MSKALVSLEDIGFIRRTSTRSLEVLPKGKEFVANPEKRSQLFAEGALRLKSFEAFINILNKHRDTGLTISQLADNLQEKLNVEWKDVTAKVYVKLMLDWARHAELAPNIFAQIRKGPPKAGNKHNFQATLF